MKKKLKIIAVIGFVLITILYMGDNFTKLYAYVDAYEMTNVIDIDVSEAELNDYTILEDEVFEEIEQKELKLLRNYMQENNLKLRCGTYEINESYTYEELLEVFEFDEE